MSSKHSFDSDDETQMSSMFSKRRRIETYDSPPATIGSPDMLRSRSVSKTISQRSQSMDEEARSVTPMQEVEQENDGYMDDFNQSDDGLSLERRPKKDIKAEKRSIAKGKQRATSAEPVRALALFPSSSSKEEMQQRRSHSYSLVRG
ncbi:hypothetical protein T439DRAFT_322246 [Meredithblackwellia eburnea MCA 4105]